MAIQKSELGKFSTEIQSYGEGGWGAMLEQYKARAIIRYLNGDTEQFEQLVNKAIGIHKGVYGEGRHLYVPIHEIIEAKGA